MERLLIWASGYNSDLLTQHRASAADKQALRKIGAALLFSTLWFAVMTALAAWTMAFLAGTGTRTGIAALAFAGAAAFVLVFDRGFVFGIDTCIASFRKALFYGIARVLVVLAIAGLVDVAVMPVMMREELRLEAAKMREAAERNRFAELNARFDIAGRQTELTEARAELVAAETAAATLPTEIAAALANANRCFATVSALRSPRYADQRRRCATRLRAAQAERAEYQRNADRRLGDAKGAFDEKLTAFNNARTTISDRFDASTEEYAELFNAANFAVFVHLISTQASAALKAAFLLIVHLVLDLLPFLMKGYFGRTGVGARIRARKQSEIFEAEAEAEAAWADSLIRIETSRAAARAARAALVRPSMVRFMEDLADYQMRAIEPLEHARTALHRAAAAECEVAGIEVRSPAMRRFKLDFWSRAVAGSLGTVAAAT